MAEDEAALAALIEEGDLGDVKDDEAIQMELQRAADAAASKKAALDKAEADRAEALKQAAERKAAEAKRKLEEEENKLLNVQAQIVQGMMLLEENDYAGAIAVFQQAQSGAELLGKIALQAKAMAGQAAAYRHIPDKKRVSGPTYEIAASLYSEAGETSDRIDCLSEAAESYRLVGQVDMAIKTLEKYDVMLAATGGKTVFTERLRELRAAPKSAKKGLLW